MRELRCSEGILRAVTLGHIRFFSRYNHIALEDFLVKVVLFELCQSPVFHLLLFLADSFVHVLVLSSYLLARSCWEVVADESEVGSVELE